jgi:hypothetical protein
MALTKHVNLSIAVEHLALSHREGVPQSCGRPEEVAETIAFSLMRTRKLPDWPMHHGQRRRRDEMSAEF